MLQLPMTALVILFNSPMDAVMAKGPNSSPFTTETQGFTRHSFCASCRSQCLCGEMFFRKTTFGKHTSLLIKITTVVTGIRLFGRLVSTQRGPGDFEFARHLHRILQRSVAIKIVHKDGRAIVTELAVLANHSIISEWFEETAACATCSARENRVLDHQVLRARPISHRRDDHVARAQFAA